MEKVKQRIISFFVKYRYMMMLTIPFWMMDIIIRITGNKVAFYPVYYPGPNLFTILWITLFTGIVVFIGGRAGKIIYCILSAVFCVMFLTNAVYYSLTGFYFNFSLLQMAGEGSSYIMDTILGTPVYVYALLIFIVIVIILVFRTASKERVFYEESRPKRLVMVILLFVVLHILAPYSLGKGTDGLKWNSFKNARDIYDNFNDSNKCMRVSGLYEYTFRNFYVIYLKPKEIMSDEDKAFMDEQYNDLMAEKNDYTGIFEGKNIIFLQLEGMDSWLLNEENTPNLYQLKNNAIDFKNHFSIYTGGGSTFNSEFAVNTGFTTPISYNENVYKLNGNTFNYTLPKLFKEQGYSVDAFHMNSGEFYNRALNYESWGYDSYNGLIDVLGMGNGSMSLTDGEDLSYELDRTLIENEEFYDKMFRNKEKFIDYIITYTPHTPFTSEKGVGKLVANMKYGEGNVPENLSEEDIAKLEAAETDYMVGLLLEALKENELYDNTVIVCYADHYLYTLEDKSILEKYKDTPVDSNLINRTPFFIWSADTQYTAVEQATMQIDILPTILNMFAVDYNPSYYLGSDIFSENYEGIVFFSDGSWYDGNVYVEMSNVTNDAEISEDELEYKNNIVSDLIRKNDLTLKYDYQKTIDE